MKTIILIVISITIVSCSPNQTNHKSVKNISAMKNVMWKGELDAKIRFDTILPQKGLYGLGPLEGLTGEITIIDGISYVSKITKDQNIEVDVDNNAGAPFFVYSISESFDNIKLPKDVTTLKQLDSFLKTDHDSDSAYLFKLSGNFEYTKIHVQNLEPNSIVTSPKEAHKGQVDVELDTIQAEIIGFYSNSAHGVFTHHDTNIHAHLITQDKKYMGHCDELKFQHDQVKLYIAKNR